MMVKAVVEVTSLTGLITPETANVTVEDVGAQATFNDVLEFSYVIEEQAMLLRIIADELTALLNDMRDGAVILKNPVVLGRGRNSLRENVY